MSAYRQKFLSFRVFRFKDTNAYGQLYDLHADRIRRFLAFKLPRREDADELTGEVFLRGWEYMTSSAVENPAAFFFRVARNLAADFYRKNSAVEHVSEEAMKNIPSAQKVDEDVATKVESDDLIEKIKSMKEEYREVLVMRYLDEMSVSEIAAALEKTPNNVRVTLHRAKKALQEIA
jgi:RNA polymerase sigma-70 factor (ECF subfamily)